MAKTGFLPKEKMKAFLDALSKDAVVQVPVAEGDVVSFKPYAADAEICLTRPANTLPTHKTNLKALLRPLYQDLKQMTTHSANHADPCSLVLLHGMQADHISLGIEDQGDPAVFSDGHFGLLNLPAGARNAAFIRGAVLTMEINQG